MIVQEQQYQNLCSTENSCKIAQASRRRVPCIHVILNIHFRFQYLRVLVTVTDRSTTDMVRFKRPVKKMRLSAEQITKIAREMREQKSLMKFIFDDDVFYLFLQKPKIELAKSLTGATRPGPMPPRSPRARTQTFEWKPAVAGVNEEWRPASGTRLPASPE